MSGVYCTCQTPNTRQTAFARANKYICPDCGQTLSPNPSTRIGQQQQNIESTHRPRSPHRQAHTQSTIDSPRGLTPSLSRPSTFDPHLNHNRPGTHITPHWDTPLRTRQIPQTPPLSTKAPHHLQRYYHQNHKYLHTTILLLSTRELPKPLNTPKLP